MMTPNIFAMDAHFVQATTKHGRNARDYIPENVLNIARVPLVPPIDCCFAQLLNPEGLQADCFVSYYWGHPFERIV